MPVNEKGMNNSVKNRIIHYYKKGGPIFLIKKVYLAIVRRLDMLTVRRKYGEKYMSCGQDNPDQTIYVIRRFSPGEGIGSTIKNTLSEMIYADEHGYKIVVDQLNYYNACLQEPEKKGKENAWEYYFEQPSGLSLEQAYNSKRVILGASVQNRHWMYPKDERKLYFDKAYRDKILEIRNKYLKFSPSVKELYDREEKTFREKYNGAKILGVSVRMSRNIEYDNYVNKGDTCFFLGAQVNPKWEDVKRDISECMTEWGCNGLLFLDDTDLYEKEIRREYADVMITGREHVFKLEDILGSGGENTFMHEAFGKGQFQKGILEYLIELMKLSLCDCLLAGQNSSTTSALIIRGEEYEHEKIYDLGTYLEVR